MRRLLGSRILPVFGFLGAAALAVLGLVMSHWFPSEVEKFRSIQQSELEVGYMEVFLGNWRNFKTPLPYFLLSVSLSLVSSVEGIINRYRYGQLATTPKDLRDEIEAHGTSKRNYYDALNETLRYLLTGGATGFTPNSRVTIYRRQESSDKFLKRVFRHSQTLKYEDGGRFRIPIDEGVVGCAWSNSGASEFSDPQGIETEPFRNAMNEHVGAEGCKPVECVLSMPSKHYVARAIDDHDSTKRIAIVVYECVEVGVLNADGIDELLKDQALQVSRYIKHLGILDAEFNPDPGEGGQ